MLNQHSLPALHHISCIAAMGHFPLLLGVLWAAIDVPCMHVKSHQLPKAFVGGNDVTDGEQLAISTPAFVLLVSTYW